jgi:mRNA-degrading endonuclease YafQ of YafQ-DinJ toxin-antitoxin module
VRKFRASKTFWKKFYALSAEQKEKTREAWKIFKADPFDPRLKTHVINALSGRAGRTIYSVKIEGDLMAVFYIEGETVWSFDIGDHGIYK